MKKAKQKKMYQNLKNQLKKGDRLIIAGKVPCHVRTVDEALDGEEGPKRDKALYETIKLINSRKETKKKYAS